MVLSAHGQDCDCRRRSHRTPAGARDTSQNISQINTGNSLPKDDLGLFGE